MVASFGVGPDGIHDVHGLPCSGLRRLEVAGDSALALWRQLAQIFPTTHLWPVIVGDGFQSPWGTPFYYGLDEDDEDEPLDDWPPAPEGILADAEKLPFDQWVARERDPLYHAEVWTQRAEKVKKIPNSDDFVAFCLRTANEYRNVTWDVKDASEYEWPAPGRVDLQETPKTALTFDDDYNYVALDKCGIVFCPVDHPWQVPAMMPFLMQEEEELSAHVSAIRWLQENFGAQLLAIGDRTLEFIPTKRPTSELAAMELAIMINSYANCPATANVNIIVEDWALYLRDSPIWSFCWSN